MSADADGVVPFDPRALPVRFSHLKAMGRSAAHYRHVIEEGRKDSPAMRVGRMVHYGVLGGMPDDEDGTLRIYEGERRGNAWKEFEAKYPGDEIVTRAEYDRAQPIIAAVKADPMAMRYLDGQHERTIEWEYAGRKCRSRLDVHSPKRFLTDLKTTTDSSPEKLMRLAWRMGYHAQCSFYEAAAVAIDEPAPESYIVGVEVNAPYVVTVLRLTPAVLLEGKRSWRGWFEHLRVCEDSNCWPGYVQQPVSWDVPAFIEGDIEDEEAAA